MKYLFLFTVILLILSCKQSSFLDNRFTLSNWHQDLEKIAKNNEVTAEELFKLECIIRFYKQKPFFDTNKSITYQQLLGLGSNFHGLDEEGNLGTSLHGEVHYQLGKTAAVTMENSESGEIVKFSKVNLYVNNQLKKPVLASRVVLCSETIHGISLGCPVFDVNRILEPTSADTIQLFYDESSIMSSYLGAFPNSEFIADKQIFWDNFKLLLQQVNFDTLVDNTKDYTKEEFYFHSGSWKQVTNSSKN